MRVRPCNKLRFLLCPHIYTNSKIRGPSNSTLKIRGAFTCCSSNVIYATICQQCPSAFYVGQMRQTSHKRINGHKFDIRTQNKEKIISKRFNCPGVKMAAVLKQYYYTSMVKEETAELTYFKRFQVISEDLNKHIGFLTHYNC